LGLRESTHEPAERSSSNSDAGLPRMRQRRLGALREEVTRAGTITAAGDDAAEQR
jgi:hypothetical protein